MTLKWPKLTLILVRLLTFSTQIIPWLSLYAPFWIQDVALIGLESISITLCKSQLKLGKSLMLNSGKLMKLLKFLQYKHFCICSRRQPNYFSGSTYKLNGQLRFVSSGGSKAWTKEIVWADNFIPRVSWGARDPTGITNFEHPASTGVIGHHTAGHRCSTKESCISSVQGTQNYHMNSLGWERI